MMTKTLMVGSIITLIAIGGLVSLSAVRSWAWKGTEGCTSDFWQSAINTDARAKQLVGINVNNAVLQTTGIDLAGNAAFAGHGNLTNDKAVSMTSGGNGIDAFYKQLGAAVFNIYYGHDKLDYIEPTTAFKTIVQQAVDGDVAGATSALEHANNMGCDLNTNKNNNNDHQVPTPKALEVAAINSGHAPSASILKLPDGYKAEPVLWNLTLPSSVAFDSGGSMYVAEAGFAYGGLTPEPRILKVDSSGNVSVFVDRMLNGPITDIEFNKNNGLLYVSHRGIISTVDSNGLIKDIVMGLPSTGDHHNNQLAFGPDGRLYISQGTATNSGVVGEDNFGFGWLKTAPTFHDTPGQNITLAGKNFQSGNPLTVDPNDNVTTGAFVPFGNSTSEGQEIQGNVKCNGCIISANVDGSDLRLEAWGLRNPYGEAFGPDGKLIISSNGADERGSRPIANDYDKIFKLDVSQGPKFYGWPDYFGSEDLQLKPVTDPQFHSDRSTQPLTFLMKTHPPVENPIAATELAAADTQVDFSTSDSFGHKGQAFIGQFGTITPIAHEPSTLESGIVGQRVLLLDPATGNVTDFISLNMPDPSFRPVGIQFNHDNDALYVVSIGKFEVRTTLPNGTPLPQPVPWGYAFTGTVWKVTHTVSGNGTTTTSPPPITNATTFTAQLSGDKEVPPTGSNATGSATFILDKNGTALQYKLNVTNIHNVTTAHIHLAPVGVNGPIVVPLFSGNQTGLVNGVLAEGTIMSGDLTGPLAGKTINDLVAEIKNGNTYVNVHSTKFPGGEIRDQIS